METDRLYLIANAHIFLCKSAQVNELSYSLAGRLHLSSGWVVLTVPASIVRGAFDAIHEPGLELPDQYAIPVMSPTEIAKIGNADKITERGHSFHYTMGPVRTADVNANGLSKTLYISIYSPELKKLRQSYGLEPYIANTHCFRLPIANRKTGVLGQNEVTKTSSYDEFDWDDYDLDARYWNDEAW